MLVERSGVPHAYATATSGASPDVQRHELLAAVAESDLPGADLAHGVTADTWRTALRQLSVSVPSDRASVVVVDEAPYLAAADPAFEGALQAVRDHELSRRPVLLLLIGSDLSMKVVAQGKDPASTTAGELAQGKPVTIGADDSIDELVATMSREKVKRLPVIDGDRLVGIVTESDVAAHAPQDTVVDLVRNVYATA